MWSREKEAAIGSLMAPLADAGGDACHGSRMEREGDGAEVEVMRRREDLAEQRGRRRKWWPQAGCTSVFFGGRVCTS